MADTVKSNRRFILPTFKVGDCVSVPPIYFGYSYSVTVPSSIVKIYGRVTYVHDVSLRVKWDPDQTEDTVKMEKVTLEENSIPLQVIVTDNLNDTEDDDMQEPTSAKEAAKSHCILVEAGLEEKDECDESSSSSSSEDENVKFLVEKVKRKKKGKKPKNGKMKAKKKKFDLRIKLNEEMNAGKQKQKKKTEDQDPRN